MANDLSEMRGYEPAYEWSKNGWICNWDSIGFRLPTEIEWWIMMNDVPPADLIVSTHHDRVVGQQMLNKNGLSECWGSIGEWVWDGASSMSELIKLEWNKIIEDYKKHAFVESLDRSSDPQVQLQLYDQMASTVFKMNTDQQMDYRLCRWDSKGKEHPLLRLSLGLNWCAHDKDCRKMLPLNGVVRSGIRFVRSAVSK